MRAACLVAAVVFTAFAALQLNDPDPAVWVAVYGAAAALSAWAWRRPLHPVLPAALGLLGLVWAGVLVLRVAGQGTTLAEVTDLRHGMLSVGIEEGREAAGLLIVAAWAAGLAAWARRRAHPALSP